jgi:hypothetical protein
MIIGPEKYVKPGDIFPVSNIGDDQYNDNQRQNHARLMICGERAIDCGSLQPEELTELQKELKEEFSKHEQSLIETQRRMDALAFGPQDPPPPAVRK